MSGALFISAALGTTVLAAVPSREPGLFDPAADHLWNRLHAAFFVRRVEVRGGIKHYVELGLGISIVTSICLTGREKLARIPLTKHFPKRTYGIVLRRGKYLSPQAIRFVEMMDPDFNLQPTVWQA